MKSTVSNPILILVALTLAKFDYAQAKINVPRKGGDCIEILSLLNLGLLNKKQFRCTRRLLADSGELWSSPEIEQCFEETYETSLYVEAGHLFLLASPEKQNSTCPTIAIDSASSDDDDKFDLVPHISLLHGVPEGALSLNHSETLEYLSRVLTDLNHATHTAVKNEYNILENNCASLLLHVSDVIALDYKEPKTNSNIINYVGKSLAADKSTVDAIRKAYLEQNTGMFVQTMFHAWNYLVGDEGMTRALVRDYMKQMED
jgi:hypothetical protein